MNKVAIKTETKKRESNFELLRIIAMLMVLVLHADFQALGSPSRGDIISSPITSTLKVFFEMASVVAVNVFILISGWFGIRPTIKGFSKFVFQYLFFAIGVYAVIILLGKTNFSIGELANCLALTPDNTYWFIPSYMCLYLFSPVLNAFINTVGKKTHIYVVLAFYAFQTVYSFLGGGASFLEKGYSAMSFMGLYLLAAFVRRYIDVRRYKRTGFLIAYILATMILTAIWMATRMHNINVINSRLLSYSNPLVIISAISLLMVFSKVKFTCATINKVSASCFAVYLLHCHPCLYATYYMGSVREAASQNFLYLIGVVIVWFVVPILLDFLRRAIWSRFLCRKS